MISCNALTMMDKQSIKVVHMFKKHICITSYVNMLKYMDITVMLKLCILSGNQTELSSPGGQGT